MNDTSAASFAKVALNELAGDGTKDNEHVSSSLTEREVVEK